MINAAGEELLSRSEGTRLTAYLCPAGIPTIGRGHTDGITHQMVRDGYTITPGQERAMFAQDMQEWERDVLACLKRKPNENQLAAFICFAYNIGIGGFKGSTALKRFEAGDDIGCADAMKLWNKITVDGIKVVSNGLVTRRAAEAALFLTPVGSMAPMPQQVDFSDIIEAAKSKQEPPMLPLLPAIISAFLPALVDAVPKLTEIFPPGSETAQRNVKAATIAFDIAKQTLSAANEQEVVEKLRTDPTAAAAVQKAVEENWFALKESGGGGIEGAGKRDAAAAARGDILQSPSFWVAMALLPLVYMIAGTVAGFWGMPFSEDVRSAIANGLVGMIIGSLAGYYFGQMTSRNRTTTP